MLVVLVQAEVLEAEGPAEEPGPLGVRHLEGTQTAAPHQDHAVVLIATGRQEVQELKDIQQVLVLLVTMVLLDLLVPQEEITEPQVRVQQETQ